MLCGAPFFTSQNRKIQKRQRCDVTSYCYWAQEIVPLFVFVSNSTLVPLENDRLYTPSGPFTASAVGAPRGLSNRGGHLQKEKRGEDIHGFSIIDVVFFVTPIRSML